MNICLQLVDTAGVAYHGISGGLNVTEAAEASQTATFNVSLSSQPTANVTIGLSSSDSSQGTVSPASLTFTSGNWNTAQTVTVTGVDDWVDDGDTMFQVVTGAAVSGDIEYSGYDAADVNVTNIDDGESPSHWLLHI